MLQAPVQKARSLHCDQGGQSVVELALLMPLMVFGLLAGADLARAFAVQIAVQNGARAGAEAYAIDSTPTVAEAQAASVAEMNRTPTIMATSSNVTITETQTDGVTPCVHPPTIATPCFVRIRVQYTFTTSTAWPWVPNTANIDRVTSFRMFY